MDVCATTVWNKPAQPLPDEQSDMKKYLLVFPFHSRQKTHKFWKHARFFAIFI